MRTTLTKNMFGKTVLLRERRSFHETIRSNLKTVSWTKVTVFAIVACVFVLLMLCDRPGGSAALSDERFPILGPEHQNTPVPTDSAGHQWPF
jgi:hypothetical protein